MHVLLLPSLGEGMPLSVIEAMKAGAIPLVNDIAGGIQELVSDGVTGFKIANNDVEFYKEKISWLFKNTTTRLKMQTNGVEFAVHYFNPIENTLNYEKEIIVSGKSVHKKQKAKIYGSRLDQSWLPNFITKTLRG